MCIRDRFEARKKLTMARKNTSITGRDGFIVPQAMLYAIGYIQSLPEERQEWSNMLDMCMICLLYTSRCV